MMHRYLLAAAITVLACAANARPADCLLIVNGKTYIDGPCKFTIRRDGFFAESFSRPVVFLTALRTIDGLVEASWNEEPGANHAHTSLGELKRDGACWANAEARFCAWKIGEMRTHFQGQRTEAPLPGQPDFAGRDRIWADYRTKIVHGIQGPPNFASFLSIVTIGCGTWCSFHPVVDRRTGKIWKFPLGGEDYVRLDLKFSVMSPDVIAFWGVEECFQQKITWTDFGFISDPARETSCNNNN